MQLALAKADSEQLARSIAEEQLSDVEKEKTMLELELKEALSRHRDELNKKEIIVTTVSDVDTPTKVLLNKFLEEEKVSRHWVIANQID